MSRIEASAPSNIALIKYMGKTGSGGNVPTNASISYTLENLRTFVTLEESARDEWKPLAGFDEIQLSATGLEKYMKHFARLKEMWGVKGNYLVRSANNFPSDCGIASSASSFAALTRATAMLASREVPVEEQSRASRLGSGSSCRSFYSPWALWRGEGAEPVELKLRLDHAVILVEEGKKAVSSSQAHARVTTSELFKGRPERAERRLEELLRAFKSDDWDSACSLCWAEFWDMHALFETSLPAFGYMQPATLAVLNAIRDHGALVTMDAGANIHVLLRPEQVTEAKRWLVDFKALTSWN